MEDVYDYLMGAIEPELTRAQIPLLDAKYQNETPEQKKARGERYAAAFAQFEHAFETLVMLWNNSLEAFQKKMLTASAKRIAEQDARKLTDLGNAFDAA